MNRLMKTRVSLISFLFILFSMVRVTALAGSGIIKTETTPTSIWPYYTLYNESSTYSVSTYAIGLWHHVPSGENYTIHWDTVAGYITPGDSTAFLAESSTLIFYGNYFPAGSPSAPTQLQTTTLSYAKIQLSWQDNADNETGFYVERKTGTLGSFSEITQLGSNSASYLDTGLTPETEYTYRVRAYNASGNSDYTNLSAATTLPGFTQPPVAGFTSSVTTLFSRMRVEFYDTSQYGDSFEWVFSNVYHFYVRETSYAPLAEDTGLYWNVKQIVTNNLGVSTASMDLRVDTNPDNLKTQSVYEGRLGYSVSWNDRSSFEQGFELFRKEETDPLTLVANIPANTTTFVDYGTDTVLGLDSTHQYGYFLRALSSDTASNFIFSASYPVANFYAFPTTGYSNYGALSVQFTNASLNATTYRWRFGDGGSSSSSNPLLHLYVSPTSAVFYSILSCGNQLGLWSSVTKAIFVNLPPVDLNALRISATQASLQWNNQNARNDGYEIYRKTGTGDYSLCTTIPGEMTGFTDTGLDPEKEYTYKARATTYQAISEYTNESSVPTSNSVDSWQLFSESGPSELLISEAILPDRYSYQSKQYLIAP